VAKSAAKRKANGADDGGKVAPKKKNAEPFPKASAGDSGDEDEDEDEDNTDEK
jgi:hypothetical protein